MSTQLMVVLVVALIVIGVIFTEIVSYAKETHEPKKYYCKRCQELNDHDH